MDDVLQVKNLSGGYSDKNILKNITFTVDRGEMFGILGPNGSGKSTLLKMISRLLPFKDGEIMVANHPIQNYSSKELAKLMAVLPQVTSEVFPFTVRETVELGRYAHQRSLFHSWSQKDESVVQEVMSLTKIKAFQDVSLQDLSGGERQRVFLAQALTQEPDILLLDEPTNHLDLSHQKGLLDQLKRWTRQRRHTVLTVFHDLNLASLYCDRLLLLDEGKIICIGSPEEVLNEPLIRRIYKTMIEKHPHPQVPKPNMVIIPETERDHQMILDGSHLSNSDEAVLFHSPIPLKTVASASSGSGMGWKEKFFISKNSSIETDPKAIEMKVQNDDQFYTNSREYHEDGFSILFVLVTNLRLQFFHTWLFINGRVCESALIEAMATSLEVKETVLREKHRPNETDDGIVVAATQKGIHFATARPTSKLGKIIRRGIMEGSAKLFNSMQAGMSK